MDARSKANPGGRRPRSQISDCRVRWAEAGRECQTKPIAAGVLSAVKRIQAAFPGQKRGCTQEQAQFGACGSLKRQFGDGGSGWPLGDGSTVSHRAIPKAFGLEAATRRTTWVVSRKTVAPAGVSGRNRADRPVSRTDAGGRKDELDRQDKGECS